MAINIYLQNIDGSKREAVVLDKYYSLAKLWPIEDSSFPLLQYVDPYGNTIFNGAQMPEIERELDRLIAQAANDEQIQVLRQVRDLAERCRRHAHKFLRFVGD